MKITTSVVLVFGVLMGAIVALALAVEDGARLTTLVSLLLGSAASAIATLATLYKVNQVADRVEKVQAHTTDLTNGLTDSKMRLAVVDVVPEDMVTLSPEQIAADRLRVQQAAQHH